MARVFVVVDGGVVGVGVVAIDVFEAKRRAEAGTTDAGDTLAAVAEGRRSNAEGARPPRRERTPDERMAFFFFFLDEREKKVV